MRLSHRVLVFLDYFSSGLLQPVLMLILLDRGCTLSTLPLALAVFALTAIALEVPSGVYADWRGRKRSFLASTVLLFASLGGVLLSRGFLPLAAAMALRGAGRALASGSLDALVIDDYLTRHGQEELSKATSLLLVLQSGGIAAGALAGGFLPITEGYTLHLLLQMGLLAVILLLSQCTLRENRRAENQGAGLGEQLRRTAALLRDRPVFWRLLACMTLLSGSMALLETYWQPTFQALSGARDNRGLSFLSAGGFLLLTLGSLVGGRAKPRAARHRWRPYLLFQGALAGVFLLLSAQRGVPGFAAAYLLLYLLLGLSNVHEQTLLNSLASDESRATVLSMASFSAQLGALILSTLSSPVVEHIGTGGVWAWSGALFLAVVLAAACSLRRLAGQPPEAREKI